MVAIGVPAPRKKKRRKFSRAEDYIQRLEQIAVSNGYDPTITQGDGPAAHWLGKEDVDRIRDRVDSEHIGEETDNRYIADQRAKNLRRWYGPRPKTREEEAGDMLLDSDEPQQYAREDFDEDELSDEEHADAKERKWRRFWNAQSNDRSVERSKHNIESPMSVPRNPDTGRPLRDQLGPEERWDYSRKDGAGEDEPDFEDEDEDPNAPEGLDARIAARRRVFSDAVSRTFSTDPAERAEAADVINRERDKHNFPGAANPPVRYAATKAPAGGIIVRGIHYKGGKFLPISNDIKGHYDRYSAVMAQRNEVRKFRRADGSYDQDAALSQPKAQPARKPAAPVATQAKPSFNRLANLGKFGHPKGKRVKNARQVKYAAKDDEPDFEEGDYQIPPEERNRRLVPRRNLVDGKHLHPRRDPTAASDATGKMRDRVMREAWLRDDARSGRDTVREAKKKPGRPRQRPSSSISGIRGDLEEGPKGTMDRVNDIRRRLLDGNPAAPVTDGGKAKEARRGRPARYAAFGEPKAPGLDSPQVAADEMFHPNGDVIHGFRRVIPKNPVFQDKGTPIPTPALMGAGIKELQRAAKKQGIHLPELEGASTIPLSVGSLNQLPDWLEGVARDYPKMVPYLQAYYNAVSRGTVPRAGTPPSRNSRKGKPRKYNAFPSSVATTQAQPQARPRFDLNQGLAPEEGGHMTTFGVGGGSRAAPPIIRLLAQQSTEGTGELSQIARAVMGGDMNSLPAWIDALADAGYPEDVIYEALGLGDKAAQRAGMHHASETNDWGPHYAISGGGSVDERGSRLRNYQQRFQP